MKLFAGLMVALTLGLAAVGCGGAGHGGGGVPVVTAVALTPTLGNNMTGPPGTAVGLSVKASDAGTGSPVQGATVVFTITSASPFDTFQQSGTQTYTTVTDNIGNAGVTLIFGGTKGTITIVVTASFNSASSAPASFTETNQ